MDGFLQSESPEADILKEERAEAIEEKDLLLYSKNLRCDDRV